MLSKVGYLVKLKQDNMDLQLVIHLYFINFYRSNFLDIYILSILSKIILFIERYYRNEGSIKERNFNKFVLQVRRYQ